MGTTAALATSARPVPAVVRSTTARAKQTEEAFKALAEAALPEKDRPTPQPQPKPKRVVAKPAAKAKASKSAAAKQVKAAKSDPKAPKATRVTARSLTVLWVDALANPTATQRCNKCGKVQPVSAFGKRGDRTDIWDRACSKASHQALADRKRAERDAAKAQAEAAEQAKQAAKAAAAAKRAARSKPLQLDSKGATVEVEVGSVVVA